MSWFARASFPSVLSPGDDRIVVQRRKKKTTKQLHRHEHTLYQASHNKATKLVYFSNRIQSHVKIVKAAVDTQRSVPASCFGGTSCYKENFYFPSLPCVQLGRLAANLTSVGHLVETRRFCSSKQM